MRGSILGVVVLFAVAGWASAVIAQVYDRDITFQHCVYLIRPVRNRVIAVNEPYTAEYQVSMQRLQKDGNTETTEFTQVFAIDSQGRWMNSRTVAPSPEDESPSTHFCVYDPVTGIRTTWSVPGKMATQMKIAEIESSHSSCEKKEIFDAEISRSKPVVEDLGTKSIQGYVAQGIKTSRLIPARKDGNRKAIVRSVETWRAALPGLNSAPGVELTHFFLLDDPWYWSKSEKQKYLGQNFSNLFETARGRTGLLVRQVIDGPEIETGSENLQDFRQSAPDPAVFQPPEGYKIVVKKAPPVVCPGEKTAPSTEPLPLPAQ